MERSQLMKKLNHIQPFLEKICHLTEKQHQKLKCQKRLGTLLHKQYNIQMSTSQNDKQTMAGIIRV